MSQLDFDSLWEAVRTLDPVKLRRIRNLADTLLLHPGLQGSVEHLRPEDRIGLGMLKEGLLSRVPPPLTDLTPYQNRRLIEVQGKPLSETIVEDRR